MVNTKCEFARKSGKSIIPKKKKKITKSTKDFPLVYSIINIFLFKYQTICIKKVFFCYSKKT